MTVSVAKKPVSLLKFKVLGDLTSWAIPNKSLRAKYKTWLKLLDMRKIIPQLKKNYSVLLAQIPTLSTKIKVLFLVSEVSKWKAQSLYDLLAKSESYEPLVILTLADYQHSLSDEEKRSVLKSNYEFFAKKQMFCEYAIDLETLEPLELKAFNPQMVFYQQPWSIFECQKPVKVSEYALTFYIPYYVQNYGHIGNECCQELHQSVFRYYILNKQWEDDYASQFKYAAGQIKGLGHTMLDVLTANQGIETNNNYIIYAPHHSLSNFENYATFLQNGKEILEYAKQHQEFNWVFKPHPSLKYALKEHGAMTDSEIEEYYSEWEKFAVVSNDSDYYKLFLDSRALITDCASFLTEYFCTGKPIIHLISSRSKIKPYSSFKVILDALYGVENLDDMYKCFEKVLVKGEDVLKEKRLETLNSCGLLGVNAAQNIMEDLELIRKGDI